MSRDGRSVQKQLGDSLKTDEAGPLLGAGSNKMNQEWLQVEGLTKTFPGGEKPAVKDVSFSLREGELFVLLGPSGCGKTTTLRMLGGFEQADAGSILLGGRVLVEGKTQCPPEQREIGFMFQDYALFPHMTVAQNVGFGLRQLPAVERSRRIQEVLAFVGMEGFGGRTPAQLSGGEQQRIALARSLAPHPKVLLLDEPFSNLDEKRREQMRVELRDLLRQWGMSAILVTHSQQEALGLADRIGVMQGGSLLQVGTPVTLYRSPSSAFVAEFLGQTNLVDAIGKGDVLEMDWGRIPNPSQVRGEVTLSIRPDSWRISHDEFSLGEVLWQTSKAKVESVSFQGAFCSVWVRESIAGKRLLVRVPATQSLQRGEFVCLGLKEPPTVLPRREVETSS